MWKITFILFFSLKMIWAQEDPLASSLNLVKNDIASLRKLEKKFHRSLDQNKKIHYAQVLANVNTDKLIQSPWIYADYFLKHNKQSYSPQLKLRLIEIAAKGLFAEGKHKETQSYLKNYLNLRATEKDDKILYYSLLLAWSYASDNRPSLSFQTLNTLLKKDFPSSPLKEQALIDLGRFYAESFSTKKTLSSLPSLSEKKLFSQGVYKGLKRYQFEHHKRAYLNLKSTGYFIPLLTLLAHGSIKSCSLSLWVDRPLPPTLNAQLLKRLIPCTQNPKSSTAVLNSLNRAYTQLNFTGIDRWPYIQVLKKIKKYPLYCEQIKLSTQELALQKDYKNLESTLRELHDFCPSPYKEFSFLKNFFQSSENKTLLLTQKKWQKLWIELEREQKESFIYSSLYTDSSFPKEFVQFYLEQISSSEKKFDLMLKQKSHFSKNQFLSFLQHWLRESLRTKDLSNLHKKLQKAVPFSQKWTQEEWTLWGNLLIANLQLSNESALKIDQHLLISRGAQFLIPTSPEFSSFYLSLVLQAELYPIISYHYPSLKKVLTQDSQNLKAYYHWLLQLDDLRLIKEQKNLPQAEIQFLNHWLTFRKTGNKRKALLEKWPTHLVFPEIKSGLIVLDQLEQFSHDLPNQKVELTHLAPLENYLDLLGQLQTLEKKDLFQKEVTRLIKKINLTLEDKVNASESFNTEEKKAVLNSFNNWSFL